MGGSNVLFMFSDEHRRDASGCYGHSLVKTPNIDKLAGQGVKFENAYTPSPICVPARAALAAGEYVHKTRCWSNAQAYEGTPASWGHQLQSQGYAVESIGKLHYKSRASDNGFDKEHLGVYIKDGIGWVKGLLRNHESVLDCSVYAEEIGSGDNGYTDFDLDVTKTACAWLKKKSNDRKTKPWVLFVSWLRPHYPLICPEQFYDMYPLENMDTARFLAENMLPAHPVVKILKKNFDYDRYFDERTRQIARASYYGLCSFLDFQIGRVLDALEQSGQMDNTLIIYSSDHGDHNGDRRMWTKMSLFEESVGIPLIARGPGFGKNKSVKTNVSLVDIRPTIMTAAGAEEDDKSRPGISLQKLAGRRDFSRPVLSEYHDGGSPTALFMMKNARWKYNCYPGYPAELYDLEHDPGEITDLGQSDSHKRIIDECHQQLRELVDPEYENRRAFDDQKKLINQLGGVDAILDAEEFDFTPVDGIRAESSAEL